jgi:hypothetical protein
MTKIIYTSLIIILTSFLFTSCKQEATSEVKNDSEIIEEEVSEDGYTIERDTRESDPVEIKAWREYAKKAIDFRRKEDNNKAWQILDVDMWEYEFVFQKQKVSEPGAMTGKWIDFDQDLTYTYGSFDVQEGSGNYHYNLDTQELLLLDDNETKKPFEYKAKIVNAIMILQGNATYKDNAYQAKLKRINQKPSK